MKLKSLLAAVALLTAPAVLAPPATAADWDGRRGYGYSDVRYDRGYDRPRAHHRHYRKRHAWWRHVRPWRSRYNRNARVRDNQNLSLQHRRLFRAARRS
jgi:hypothetical protein